MFRAFFGTPLRSGGFGARTANVPNAHTQQVRLLTRRDRRKRTEFARRAASVLAALGATYVAFEAADAIRQYRDPVHEDRPKVVVLGAGFGALAFAQGLDHKRFEVRVVAPRGHFLYTPALAETLFGALDPQSVLEPVRAFRARSRRDFAFFEAACDDVDFEGKKVRCVPAQSGEPFELSYDYLVVATGAKNDTLGVPGVAEHALFLDSLNDARRLRNKVLTALENAALPSKNQYENEKENEKETGKEKGTKEKSKEEAKGEAKVDAKKEAKGEAKEESQKEARPSLHFVVVGGSPVARQIAQGLSDFIDRTVKEEYPELAEEAKVTLVASSDHVHNYYDHAIAKYYKARHTKSHGEGAEHAVIKAGQIAAVTAQGLTLKSDKEGDPQPLIEAGTVIWATGRAPSAFTQRLRSKLPKEQRNQFALLTDHSLRLRGAEDVYALGDCATMDQSALMAKWEGLFKETDVNGDGVIDRDEFRALCKSVGRRYPALLEVAVRADQLFARGDANADGKLSVTEFEDLMRYLDATLTRFPATASTAVQQGQFLASEFNAGSHLIKDSEGEEAERAPFRYKHIGGFEYVGAEDGLVERGSQGTSIVSGAGAWWLWNNVYFSSMLGVPMRVRMAVSATLSAILGNEAARY